MNHEDRRRWPARSSRVVGLLMVGLLPLLGACYPYDRESTSDYDVIATTFDPNADFSTKQTYARPPDVRVVTDPDQEEADDTLNPQVQAAILAAIDQNMAALGYVPANGSDPTVTTPNQPDVVVVPFAAESTWVGGSCYPYYWDYWYGGYGWCYPVYYSYTTGTVVITMRDPTDISPTAEPLWVAGINGIIGTDTPSSTAARAGNAVNAAFSQSPYLDTN